MVDQMMPGGQSAPLWVRNRKRIQAAIDDAITSRVVVTDFGTGFIEVTSGDPNDTARRTIPSAYGLAVESGDTVLTVKVGGRETAILILTRAT